MSAMRAILDQRGASTDNIGLNVSPTSVEFVSPVRLRQYVYEREEKLAAKRRRDENRRRQIETAAIVITTAITTTAGNLFVQWLAAGCRVLDA
jgi:hypothetical protein